MNTFNTKINILVRDCYRRSKKSIAFHQFGPSWSCRVPCSKLLLLWLNLVLFCSEPFTVTWIRSSPFCRANRVLFRRSASFGIFQEPGPPARDYRLIQPCWCIATSRMANELLCIKFTFVIAQWCCTMRFHLSNCGQLCYSLMVDFECLERRKSKEDFFWSAAECEKFHKQEMERPTRNHITLTPTISCPESWIPLSFHSKRATSTVFKNNGPGYKQPLSSKSQ